LNWKEDLAAKC